MAAGDTNLEALARIESALIAAIGDADIEQAAALGGERDRLLRDALPNMDGEALSVMAQGDARLRNAVVACRQRLAGELQNVRKGRAAIGEYSAVNAHG